MFLLPNEVGTKFMKLKKSRVNLTEAEYKALSVSSRKNLKFEFYEPALLGMENIFRPTSNGKDMEEFKVTVTCVLKGNRFFNYNISTEGLHKHNLQLLDEYFIRMGVWELAMKEFKYDLGFSFLTYSDDQYDKYWNHLGFGVNSISKSNMKALILATDYLKFVDFFEYKMAMVWLANKDYLSKGFKTYLDFYDVPKEVVKKRTDVMRTTVGRIPSDLLIKAGGKGNIGGTLSANAEQNIFLYVQANNSSSKLVDYLESITFHSEVKSNG